MNGNPNDGATKYDELPQRRAATAEQYEAWSWVGDQFVRRANEDFEGSLLPKAPAEQSEHVLPARWSAPPPPQSRIIQSMEVNKRSTEVFEIRLLSAAKSSQWDSDSHKVA